MPCQMRLEYPGGVYHVIRREYRRENIHVDNVAPCYLFPSFDEVALGWDCLTAAFESAIHTIVNVDVILMGDRIATIASHDWDRALAAGMPCRYKYRL